MANASINEKLWEFLLSGGLFMAFIAACSLVAMAVAIHRALSLRWGAVIPRYLEKEMGRCGHHFEQGKAPHLLALFRRSDSPAGRTARIAVSPEFENREEATQAVESNAREEIVKLENGMGVLEVVITIAPLLGLLGTVSGLVGVFAELGEDVAEPTAIAAGIAKALNTTIAGLVVAVITVILHSIFVRRLESVAARMDVLMSQLLHQFYKHGGPALYDAEPLPEGEDPADLEAAGRLLPPPEQENQRVESSNFLS